MNSARCHIGETSIYGGVHFRVFLSCSLRNLYNDFRRRDAFSGRHRLVGFSWLRSYRSLR